MKLVRYATRHIISLVFIASAVLQISACATLPQVIRIHTNERVVFDDLMVDVIPGLPGSTTLQFQNDGMFPAKIEVFPRAPIIGVAYESSVEETGTTTREICTEDGVCVIVNEPVYETREKEVSIVGNIEAAQTTITLDSHETDRIGITILNFGESNRGFEVRIHFVIDTDGEITRGVFILTEDAFMPQLFAG